MDGMRYIIKFKCLVNIYAQDFGVFCRGRGPEGRKLKGEQHAKNGGLEEEPLVDKVGVEGGVGGGIRDCGGGQVFLDMLGAVLDGVWALGLSLRGWLWWLWEYRDTNFCHNQAVRLRC